MSVGPPHAGRPGLQAVVIVACLFFVGPTTPLTHASTPHERETLRNLSGVVLNSINFTSTPTDLEQHLPLVELRSEVESEMRQAGIPLIAPDRLTSSVEVPRLQIQGAVSQITANFYAYTIVIELHQEASLIKTGGQRSVVVTWSEGSLSTGDITHFRDRLLLLVRLFIRDFHSVNAPSSRIFPLRWMPSTQENSIPDSRAPSLVTSRFWSQD